MGIMDWTALVSVAVALMGRANEIMDLVRSMGVSQEDIDKVIAQNREERRTRLARDRKNDWPE